jgi:uncharacterized protein YjbI with pentapeptide repeats
VCGRTGIAIRRDDVGSRIAVGVVGIALAVIVGAFVLKWAPEWLATDGPKDKAEEVGRTRTALLAALAGLIAIAGAWFTGLTYLLSRSGQVTERFTSAVEQLGNADNPLVRRGGIYALERIAYDSRRDHPRVMEVLTAYARCPPLVKDGRNISAPERPENVQAALAVLQRRKHLWDEYRLDLTSLNLPGAKLPACHLRGVLLAGARLENADLKLADLGERRPGGKEPQGAVLTNVDLKGADLKGTILQGANLEGADLQGAHLEGADLHEAHLASANLQDAHLERADLRGAILNDANLDNGSLDDADLRGAYLNGATLASAHLFKTDLREAQLVRASLPAAYLSDAKLQGAHLAGADLTDARLGGANLDGATFNPKTTRWPTQDFDARARGARPKPE